MYQIIAYFFFFDNLTHQKLSPISAINKNSFRSALLFLILFFFDSKILILKISPKFSFICQIKKLNLLFFSKMSPFRFTFFQNYFLLILFHFQIFFFLVEIYFLRQFLFNSCNPSPCLCDWILTTRVFLFKIFYQFFGHSYCS
jgi:hypothetical protein